MKKLVTGALGAVLVTGAVIGSTAPAEAASRPKCIHVHKVSAHKVNVYNKCKRQYAVKAIFKWGKDVTQGIGPGDAYALSSGSLSRYQRTIVLN